VDQRQRPGVQQAMRERAPEARLERYGTEGLRFES
jgi:hypothetical protein